MSQETKNYQYERNDFNTYGVRGSATGGGTEVVANPTLAGTESALTGLQVGDTKYKIDTINNTINEYPYGSITNAETLAQLTADLEAHKPIKMATAVGNYIFNSITGNSPYGDYYWYIQLPTTEPYTNATTIDLHILKIDLRASEAYIFNSSSATATKTTANPTLAGTESALTGLQVGDTKYKVDSGMANPMTTAGDIIYGGSSGTPTRLSISTLGHDWLKCDSIQHQPVWSQITKDDIYINSGNQYKTMYVSSNSSGFSVNLGKPAQNFGLGYTTTAPSADNTDGLKIVVLSSEPATYYDGYYYIIAPST